MVALTYYECLEKLELQEGYTIEQLKKNYKRIIKKYHPDKHIEESLEEQEKVEEEAKKINEAYGKLLKKLQGEYVNFSSNSRVEDIIIYKTQVLAKIQTYIKDIDKLEDKISKDFNLKLATLSYNLNIIRLCKTKKNIEKHFNEFKEEVVEANKYIKEKLFNSEFINESELNINYDKPIYEFYNEMQELVKKHSKKSKLEKELKEEAKSYEYYAYYNDIKDIIDELIEKSLKKAEARKYKKTDDIVVEFNVQVLEEFEKCAKVMSLVNEQINNGNLSNSRLNKLKDILANYSKYGYKKSLDIINQKEEEFYKKSSIQESKVRILVKKNILTLGPEFVFGMKTDEKEVLLYISKEGRVLSLFSNDDLRRYEISIDNVYKLYMPLKDFVQESETIGFIGQFENLDGFDDEVKIFFRRNNSLIVQYMDGSIGLEMGKFIKKKAMSESVTYERLAKELLKSYKESLFNTLSDDAKRKL